MLSSASSLSSDFGWPFLVNSLLFKDGKGPAMVELFVLSRDRPPESLDVPPLCLAHRDQTAPSMGVLTQSMARLTSNVVQKTGHIMVCVRRVSWTWRSDASTSIRTMATILTLEEEQC